MTRKKQGIFKREALIIVVSRIVWPVVGLALGYVILRLVLG